MLKARQRLGKYRIVRRLSNGPLASVYQATDTVLDKQVALKVPPADDSGLIDSFVHEARVASRLTHPNILTIFDASYVENVFVISMPLGIESLADRIERRISRELALNYASQALAAVAYAHSKRVMHCDIKPENFIIFPGNTLKLCDFGFAKFSARTVKASGSGTIEYIAPEQAMGRPKLQSDVFSLGLVLCRLLGGKLPEWPFEWPPSSIDRLKKWLTPEAVEVLRCAIEVNPDYRYTSAARLETAFRRAQRTNSRKKLQSGTKPASRSSSSRKWQQLRQKECRQRFGSALNLKHECRRCHGPVSEAMQHCPWCASENPTRGSMTSMPRRCPHCDRGVKSDWRYCPWCYGRGFEEETSRRFSDRRYVARCEKSSCGQPLMRFMRYCPWCHTRVRRKWSIPQSRSSCTSCGWGVAKDYWEHCAWCSAPVKRRSNAKVKRA